MKLQARQNTNDSMIIYDGVFAGHVDIRVEDPTDGGETITIYANNHLVGTLRTWEVAEQMNTEGVSFADCVDEFLQLANVGR